MLNQINSKVLMLLFNNNKIHNNSSIQYQIKGRQQQNLNKN